MGSKVKLDWAEEWMGDEEVEETQTGNAFQKLNFKREKKKKPYIYIKHVLEGDVEKREAACCILF